MGWTSYPCRLSGRPAVIDVDLDVKAPDPALPRLIYASVRLSAPDDLGLPTAVDLEALEALEDELESAFAGDGARLVGRVSTAGRQDLFFYAPGGEALDVAVTVVDEFDALAVDLGSHEDPDWTHYLDVLHPGPSAVLGDGSAGGAAPEA